jgi:Heparinase II/III-like protein
MLDITTRSPLTRLVPKRPRLMATPALIARMQAALKEHRAKEWTGKVVEQADCLLTLPPLSPKRTHDPTELVGPPLSPPLQRDPSGGASATTLDIARCFVLRIQTLGIVWFVTGEQRYRDRAIKELLAMCAFADWQGDEFLVTAETMFGAAIGYDWLFQALSYADRQAVASAILSKGVRPGLDEFAADPPARWTTQRTNWNLVCNGALLIAALSVAERDWSAAGRIFDLCRQSISTGFDAYQPDGGWAEGPGYWHYGTQYAVYLVDSLTTALGEDLSLGGSPGFSNTGLFRLHAAGPSGKLFNFADSEEEHSGGYWLFWFAKRYHHPVDAWIEQQRGKASPAKVHPMDLLWFDPDARGASSDHLRSGHGFLGIDVAMLRGDWKNPKATYLGIKGGANDACRHAHYDLGSFVLDADGVRWAVDLGPDDYHLPDYFDPEARSRYYRTSTLGHNTIVIDGQSQPPTGRAFIVHTQFEPSLSRIVLDMTLAYPGCRRARRGYALIDGRHVVITDEIMPGRPLSSVVWQMHTTAKIEQRGGSVRLVQTAAGAEPARLFIRIVEPEGRVFATASATPNGPAGQNPNHGISKVTIDVGQVEAEAPLRLTVILSPDEAACASLDLPGIIARPVGEWSGTLHP